MSVLHAVLGAILFVSVEPTMDLKPAPECECARWVQADGGYECKQPVCPTKRDKR